MASLVGIMLYIGCASASRSPSAPSSPRCTTSDDGRVPDSFFGYELSLNVVAAILTITGYSVNDTIVVFDRVRENLRAMRREPLLHVVNRSVNQTLRARSSRPARRSWRCWRSSCSAAKC
jgi:hypothetical protein